MMCTNWPTKDRSRPSEHIQGAVDQGYELLLTPVRRHASVGREGLPISRHGVSLLDRKQLCLMIRQLSNRSIVMRGKLTARKSTYPGPSAPYPPAKRYLAGQNKEEAKKIGTHSGSFHCDEALGCWLLKQLPGYDLDIVRSRDPEILKECHIVLDVGGEYIPAKRRFDHHQKGFLEYFPGFQTKLSSAGLIYKHYGKQIVSKIMGLPEGDPDVETVYVAAYKNFMEAIDAIDNGINQWEGNQTPKYVSNPHLSARVGQLNPEWNEDLDDDEMDERFEEAMELTGGEFRSKVVWLSEVWLPARSIVETALQEAKDIDESGEIIHFKTGCPWKEHLYDLEKELRIEKPIKYVLYGDKEGKYRVQAVGLPGSFESRKALPAEWRGLRDEKLSEVSGIPGCIFVHASGFMGGSQSFDGAVAMAKKALSM